MAITIRNKETEELIRKIGRRTGEGPSAVVRRLAVAEAGSMEGAPSQKEIARRMTRIEELRKQYSRPDDPNLTWEEIEEEMDSIFGDELDDENPRSGSGSSL